MLRHQNSVPHRHRFKRLRSALRAASSHSSLALALESRLQKCGGPEWGNRFTCRKHACPACRDRSIAAERRKAERHFAGAQNTEMALLTVILGTVRDVKDIADVMSKARKDLRNLIDAERRRSRLWDPVEVMVWLETDACDLADYARLGPDKQIQVAEFMPVFAQTEGVVWIPSLHGIVRFGPGLDAVRVRAAFERKWPGHKRVDVEPFWADQTLNQNLGRIINYACKHTCTTDYYDAETGEITPCEWETSWLKDYYTWLSEWSRGFQATRIFLRAKKQKRKKRTASRFDENNNDIEPLPFVYGNSIFHRDYYY